MLDLPSDMQATIPPKGKITLPGIMLTGILNVPSALDVTMIYEAVTDNGKSLYTSRFKFFIDHSLTSPERFTPSIVQEIAGAVDISKGFMTELLDTLPKSKGTIHFVLPERKPDGTSNVVTFSGGGKRFLFDPNNQIAAFSARDQSGDVRIASARIDTGKGNGRHSIDETKDLLLMVDGKVTRTQSPKP